MQYKKLLVGKLQSAPQVRFASFLVMVSHSKRYSIHSYDVKVPKLSFQIHALDPKVEFQGFTALNLCAGDLGRCGFGDSSGRFEKPRVFNSKIGGTLFLNAIIET